MLAAHSLPMARAHGSEIGQLLSSPDGLGYDVPVPDQAYDGKTILRLVKRVNRRGLVRYFQIWRGGKEWRWTRSPYGIVKGEDDLETFVGGSGVIVSFEDRFEARMFARDLASSIINPKAREQLRREMDERQKIAASHTPERYPEPLMVGRTGEKRKLGWLKLVNPKALDAFEIDTWTRKHIKQRCHPALWLVNTKWAQPRLIKKSQRYWRLSVIDWQNLIARSDEQDMAIIYFTSPDDYERFDRRYGPSQFLSGRSLGHTSCY